MTAATAEPEVLSTREFVHHQLAVGGRIRVTVTSRASGEHLSLRIACKRRNTDGRGFVSRARRDGRVGLGAADVVFIDADDHALLEPAIGRIDMATGAWYAASWQDDPRADFYGWAGRSILRWARGEFPAFETQAEISLRSECSVCGKPLSDPASIARGLGPECYGAHTDSTHV